MLPARSASTRGWRVLVISSSTLEMSTWDSKGFVRWPLAPAASARLRSKGSNVPVNRRTGIQEVSGFLFSFSQTSYPLASGMITSSKAMSGRTSWAFFRAWTPFPTLKTL